MTLKDFFEENKSVAVAFSGGTDSSFLLYEASKLCPHTAAIYVKSAFQPGFELEDAMKIAEFVRVPLFIAETDILSCGEVSGNPPDRCYLCKRRIFSLISVIAAEHGCDCIVDGTNLSDDPTDRPGMRALRELGVRSPLKECGYTKDMIREKSREYGLFTWDKPAYACLATRIPTGMRITEELLDKTCAAESFMAHEGFRDFRVRTTADGAKIQIREEQLPLLLEKRDEVNRELKKYYACVTLDLEVRK